MYAVRIAINVLFKKFYSALFSIGGETIRGIIKACGAHVELNRAIPESSPTKCFIIRGTVSQLGSIISYDSIN